MQIYRYTPRDVWGINNFKIYLDDVTFGMETLQLKAVCKWLDISEKTLHRWLAEESPVPRAVCYALFHESQYGRGLAEVTAFNGRAFLDAEIAQLKQDVRTLQANNDALRAAADAAAPMLSANDASYGARPVARRPHAFSEFKARRVRYHRL